MGRRPARNGAKDLAALCDSVKHLGADDRQYVQFIVPYHALRLQVRACSTGVRNPLPYDSVGLQYCKLDTRQPGNYTISFHLLWPSLDEIVVYRQAFKPKEQPGCHALLVSCPS